MPITSQPITRLYYWEDFRDDDGSKWSRLLDYALDKAELVEFAIPRHESEWPDVLKPLAPFLVERYVSRWRWQCRQPGDTPFLRFELPPEVETCLRAIPTLAEWDLPWPEDPSFYHDDEAIVWTISHEGHALILLEEDEADELRRIGFVLEDKCKPEPPTRRKR